MAFCLRGQHRTENARDLIPIERLFLVKNNNETSEKGGSPRSHAVFTGLLRCGLCGLAMRTETATSANGDRHHYYNCQTSQKGAGCESKRIAVSKFDAEMTKAILDKILTKERMIQTIEDIYNSTSEWAKDRERRRAELVAQMRNNERKTNKIYDILQETGTKTPGLAGLIARADELKGELVGIETKLDELECETLPAELISETDAAEMEKILREIITNAKNPQKLREFFKTFIRKIVINEMDGERYARIEYHPDKFVNKLGMDFVRSGAGWLPDQGSNLGPAD
jgi:site-specific DNA recombinase